MFIMKDIQDIIAKNLVGLRTKHNLTQAELAEKINYTDKSISKWENGDSLPPVDVLKVLAEFYNVSLDYLVNEIPEEFFNKKIKAKRNKRNKLMITLLATSIVWIVATIIFVYGQVAEIDRIWISFVAGVPISSIIVLIFNCIWFKRKYIFLIVSVLVWSTIATVYLSILQLNMWPLFIIGIPLQFAIILWSQLKIINVK